LHAQFSQLNPWRIPVPVEAQKKMVDKGKINASGPNLTPFAPFNFNLIPIKIFQLQGYNHYVSIYIPNFIFLK